MGQGAGGAALERTVGTARAGGLALLVLVVLALSAGSVLTRLALREGEERAAATLTLTAGALEGWLRRFEMTPRLLADDDVVSRVLLAPAAFDRAARLQEADRWLEGRNSMLGTEAIYLIDVDGTTLAASNYAAPDSFVGQNFAYRPYFTEAVAGRPGRFFGIGTTSGVRGYYFAEPVVDAAGRVAGVVAVKVGLDDVEAGWRGGDARVMVTDPDGVVFLSSDPAWLYASLAPLSAEQTERAVAVRRYADVAPRVLAAARREEAGVALLSAPGDQGWRDYVEARRLMPEAGWTLHVLLDTGPLRTQARVATALVVALAGLAALGALALWQRRLRAQERVALEARLAEEARAALEGLVASRTAALTEANRLVRLEVAERRAAEAELRRTQADLVQAGKLAALGRISAALSHEINQPLAAVRTYADNATLFLQRGRPERAEENLRLIMTLVDRMAAIARHLREVARKPEAPLADVDLGAAVAEALVVAGPRLAAVGAELSTDLAGAGAVRAGPVRLQQVLVNLLANAADAVEGLPDRRVRVSAEAAGGRVRLTVADSGAGVPDAIADRIFEPFFTTKGVGAGLGLGLSITYNIVRDFGGELTVARAPEGGAAFTVTLDAASVRLAAE